MRLGRLGPRRESPYEIVHQAHHYRLRHYGDGSGGPVALLVPPLMLTAEIYDVAPDLSTVSVLGAAGVDAWVVDFGAPEREEGGMSRTLDDHVRAVADAVTRVRAATGRDVHLAGYSQGGMFAYQAAAYLGSIERERSGGSESGGAAGGLASVITFGSPVDIHRNLPKVSTDVVARLAQALEPVLEPALERIEGLPGVLTSTGFKLLSFRKEVAGLVDLVQKLHDRQALEKRESRRRFLAGEGFVAWPGPALRKFVDEFIVHNRMVSGGFVIDGRAVTLADMRCPVLYFVGTRDEIARPASVRAIGAAAPRAEGFEVTVPAGHFGLVVGSTANRETWPTVVEWMRWREGLGPQPAAIGGGEGAADELAEEEHENEALASSMDVELFYEVASEALGSVWNKLGDAFVDVGDAIDDLRYQLPRLSELRRMRDDTQVSFGRSLAEQARAIPEKTFFLWSGRAFSYADADRRVDAVVRGLVSRGVRPADRVGVLMDGRPSFLSMVTALNRLGAVAVLMSPRLDREALERAVKMEPLRFLAVDPENAERGRAALGAVIGDKESAGPAGEVMVLGGGPNRGVPEGVVDLEAIDPAGVELPDWYAPNPGRAEDLAMVLVSMGEEGAIRAARITNRRWALSALGAAAACTLTSADTVYCCLPLHHPAGLLVSVGSALVGGARLALATRFSAAVFWQEVRSYGATVVFYAGEMCRELVRGKVTGEERRTSLRLFAGSGLRADVWSRLVERSGAGVLELYGSTEGTLVLANAGGDKMGAIGRPLPGSAEPAVVAYDFERGEVVRDSHGRAMRVSAGRAGMLVARLSARAAERAASGASAGRLLRGLFAEGDTWLATGDLARYDEDGDFWLVDRIADVIRSAEGPIPSRPIEETLYDLPEVAVAVVHGLELEGAESEVPVAAIELCAGAELDHAELFRLLSEQHPEASWPRVVRIVGEIPMTEGYRPLKAGLRREGVSAGAGRRLTLDVERRAYVER